MVRKGKKSMCFNGRRKGRRCGKSYKKERTVDFPSDIIREILSRLPIEAVMRSKCVCKRWYTLISDPHFIDLQRNKASGQQCSIILRPESSCGDWPKLLLVDNVEGKWKCKELPIEIKTCFIVVGSCNGLLCIASTQCRDDNIEGPVYICNPITRECEKLPDLNSDGVSIDDRGRFLFGFGFDSISKKYKVICVYRMYSWDTDHYEGDNLYVGNLTEEDLATRGLIATVGEGSWREIKVPYSVVYNNTVFLDGAFYWMIAEDSRTSGSERILALNINTEEFHAIKFPLSFNLAGISEDSGCLINFEDSLMIVESDELHNLFRVWQIRRSQTSGVLGDEYICQLSPGTSEEYCCRMIGTLGDGNFVFHATGKIQRGEMQQISAPGHSLAIYDRRKKCSFIPEIFGGPSRFSAHLFLPTLLSPSLQTEETEKGLPTRAKRRRTGIP